MRANAVLPLGSRFALTLAGRGLELVENHADLMPRCPDDLTYLDGAVAAATQQGNLVLLGQPLYCDGSQEAAYPFKCACNGSSARTYRVTVVGITPSSLFGSS